ncbi:hypothetical protein N0V86_006244 [Didymella sp. IMI 355093]|nr:hypothetical protein N0V86_006244 [Didymella sp. IMI 355093]
MVIGSPQPAPALNVLPPASRFMREPEIRAAATAARPSFQDSNGVLVNGSSTPSERDGCGAAYLDAPPRSLQPPLLPTQSRPATINPFAGVYGNLHAVKTGSQSPPVNYEVAAQGALPQEQQHQVEGRNNDDLVYGLPPEGESTPESWFYAKMIEIVNDYYEQLQSVIQEAYEAGQISEEQCLRDKWTYRKALDRKLRIVEDMSGYKVQAYRTHLPNMLTLQEILTNENETKRAIQQPTGYAIYSSLLKICDRETWQRIFEPTTTYSHLGVITSTSQQREIEQEISVMWFLRRIGQWLRCMLAVPDDPDLKMYSSRHPPAPDPKFVTYQTNVGVLGPNIPHRPQETSGSANTASTINIQPITSQNLAPWDQARPSTHTERPLKPLIDTTRINNNTTSTGATLASPINGRIEVAARSRGYEQGAFVTIVTPSAVSTKNEKTTARCGAGKLGRKQRLMDDETAVTTWSEANC